MIELHFRRFLFTLEPPVPDKLSRAQYNDFLRFIRSSANEHWTATGSVTPGGIVSLPPMSITTIRFVAP
jgi:hypothetical protein